MVPGLFRGIFWKVGMMKVLNLEVENFMGVRAVEITPDGPVVTIGGKNGQGKSSVLNAMISALAGAKELPGVAVRDGEESAVTRVVLSRPEGDLHITRVVREGGKTTLTVKSADGAKYGKPQQLLDALVGAVGFDPHEFTRLDAKKQAERLRELVGVDTTTIDLEAAEVYRERTDVNRDVKRLEGVVASMPRHELGTDALVDSAELFAELEAARKTTREAEQAEATWREHKEGVARTKCELSEVRDQIAHLEKRATELEDNIRLREERCGVAKEVFESCQKSVVDESEIMERLRGAEAHNEKVAENTRRSKAEAELAEKRAESDGLTKKLAALEAKKTKAMSSAKWPVEGLGFDDSGVTYQGRPFAQASSAEQLRVSLAMGMALNPQLRVLVIRDGSLIDDETMAVIRDAVAERDFQLWVEKVSASGEGCTVVIEDGTVRAAK